MNKNVFKRYEMKYILTPDQYEIVLKEVKKHLHIDSYGETTIQSLYYDTPSYRLIRNSIESPEYKEKMRIRSYGLATSESTVFLELKKKFQKVVYKRRIELLEKDINNFIVNRISNNTQIEKEILYFCEYYQDLRPSMLLLYDRSAYITKDSDLRITFDKNTRYRTENLNLCIGLEGTKLLPNGEVLMEIKSALGYPDWLIKLLNENNIYKAKFSKYGTAYKIEQAKKEEENLYV